MSGKSVLVLVILCVAVVGAGADEVTIPYTFTAGTTAKASEVNDNFLAVKTAVDDNNDRISTLEATDITEVVAGSGLDGGGSSGEVTLSVGTGAITGDHLAADAVTTLKVEDDSLTSVDIKNEAGIRREFWAGGTMIMGDATEVDSVTITPPAAGYIIVQATGYVSWLIDEAQEGRFVMKISETSKDVVSALGYSEIRFQSGLGTGAYSWPFCVQQVYHNVSTSPRTFYFNAQTVVGTDYPLINLYNLTALYVPTQY